jgi:hypothetical protein
MWGQLGRRLRSKRSFFEKAAQKMLALVVSRSPAPVIKSFLVLFSKKNRLLTPAAL